MKTEELEGPLLDYWVCKVKGYSSIRIQDNKCVVTVSNGIQMAKNYSVNWSQCGPLIEQYQISLLFVDEYECWWKATLINEITKHKECCDQVSINPLEAICRCIVASKYGDEVEDNNRG